MYHERQALNTDGTRHACHHRASWGELHGVKSMRSERWNGGTLRVAACAVLLGLAAAASARAQDVPSAAPVSQPSGQELKPNPALALRDFEPALNQAYELGRGDEITITFSGRPEMNGQHIIGPDGKITLPLAGSIELADKTREEAADAVVKALSPYYPNLYVTVGVDKYTSNQVLLLGAVERPGVQTFDRPPTLLEVVSRGGASLSNRNASFGGGGGGTAGGAFNLNANLQPANLGIPERCAIYRGSDKVLWVDLKSLLDSGSPLADLRLKRDDIVYVPSSSERYVSVLGEVQHPGALQLDSTTTLPKLIALAGGLTPLAGHYPDIQIVSPTTGKTRVISFKQVLMPGSLELTLHSGDIVYVAESGFNRFAYVLEKISPLVTLFTASALITQ